MSLCTSQSVPKAVFTTQFLALTYKSETSVQIMSL